MKYKIFVSVVTLAFFICVIIGLKKVLYYSFDKGIQPLEISQKNILTPSETVELFVQNAILDDKEVTKNLICPYPKQFFECWGETQEECLASKLDKNNFSQKMQSDSNKERVTIVAEPLFSLAIEGFAKNINKRMIFFHSIKSEWKNDNEARVRIIYGVGKIYEEKDILLFLENDVWKLFDLVKPNEHLNFALPQKSQNKNI